MSAPCDQINKWGQGNINDLYHSLVIIVYIMTQFVHQVRPLADDYGDFSGNADDFGGYVNTCPTMCTCTNTNLTCERENLTSVFVMSKNTTVISFAYNNITSWNTHSFPYLYYVVSLDLSYNSLDSIQPDTLFNFPSLIRLDLSHNNINIKHHLVDTERIFSHRNLEYLDLSYNQLTEISEGYIIGKALTYLSLRSNNIKVLSRRALGEINSLEYLDLSQNPIESLQYDTFADISELKYLNLSTTLLQGIPLNLFIPLQQLQSIDLSYNSIERLQSAHFKTNAALDVINLIGNTIKCNCDIFDFYNWIKTLPTSFKVTAICDSPIGYSGIRLAILSRSEFAHCSSIVIPTSNPNEPPATTADSLPYDPMLGWYTAAVLMGMLVLFLICIVLDKLKRKFMKWRKKQKYAKDMNKYSQSSDDYLNITADDAKMLSRDFYGVYADTLLKDMRSVSDREMYLRHDLSGQFYYNPETLLPKQYSDSRLPKQHSMDSRLPKQHSMDSRLPKQHSFDSRLPKQHSFDSRLHVPNRYVDIRHKIERPTALPTRLRRQQAINGYADGSLSFDCAGGSALNSQMKASSQELALANQKLSIKDKTIQKKPIKGVSKSGTSGELPVVINDLDLGIKVLEIHPDCPIHSGKLSKSTRNIMDGTTLI